MLDFYNESGLFNVSSLYKKDPLFPRTLIISWQLQFEKELDKLYKPEPYAKKICEGGCLVTVKIINENNQKLGFALLPSGGPIVAMFIEEAKALGAENFVFIGSCGTITDNPIQTMIVPNKALRDEGTSYHYTPSKDQFINVETAAFTESFLKDNNINYVMAPTWTTDSIFRETPSAVEKAKELGCISVEMECASIMAVAKSVNVKAYQILFSADSINKKEWKSGRLHNMESNSYSNYLKTAISLAVKANSN